MKRTSRQKEVIQTRSPQQVLAHSQDDVLSTSKTRRSPQPPQTAWQKALPWILACFSLELLFIAGSHERWVYALLLSQIGLLMIMRAPQMLLAGPVNWLLLAFFGCASVALIPKAILPVPEWRKQLGEAFGGVLPITYSPQPWLSAEGLVVLGMALAWFYWVATAPLPRSGRHTTVRLYAIVTIILASLCLFFHYFQSLTPSFWNSPRAFGPFANRNNTGNVLGIGAMLTVICGIEALRKKEKSGWIFFAGLVVLVPALLLNYSRTGIVVPILGLAIWSALVFLYNRSIKQFGLGLSALIIAAILFAFFGGEAAGRFSLAGPLSIQSFFGYRWLVFSDAIKVGGNPFLGSGIGTFEPLFALAQKDSFLSTNRAIHPESDWVWLWVEMGWVGLLLCLAIIGFLLRAIFMLQRDKGWRLDRGILAAVLAFMFHGFMNPSGHFMGAALPGLMLAGLAVNPLPRVEAGRYAQIGFRIAGGLLIAAGTIWAAEQASLITVPGKLSIIRAEAEVLRSFKANDLQGAHTAATRGLESAPLHWQLYHQRALAGVTLRKWQDAQLDFQRANILQPLRPELPMNEGTAWRKASVEFAIQAWKEALRRDPAGAPKRFTWMLAQAKDNTALFPGLKSMATTDPRLEWLWLKQVTPERFGAELTDLLRRDPELSRFDNTQLEELFSLWAQRLPPRGMIESISARPHWMAAGWPWVAHHLASQGDPKGGYELAQKMLPPPRLPPPPPARPLGELLTNFSVAPGNPAAVYAFVLAEKERGEFALAFNALKTATAISGAPSYFFYMQAETAGQLKHWDQAWLAIARYGRDHSKVLAELPDIMPAAVAP